jgi:hypothetical protein
MLVSSFMMNVQGPANSKLMRNPNSSKATDVRLPVARRSVVEPQVALHVVQMLDSGRMLIGERE